MKRVYRKRSYPLDEIRRFLEPGPIVLVSSTWRGTSNVMTMGWHMMLGFSPALFGCYVWEENHSYQMLRRSKECVINLPTLDLVDTVVGIGNLRARAGMSLSSRVLDLVGRRVPRLSCLNSFSLSRSWITRLPGSREWKTRMSRLAHHCAPPRDDRDGSR